MQLCHLRRDRQSRHQQAVSRLVSTGNGRQREGLNFIAFGRRAWDDATWRENVKEILTGKLNASGPTLERFVNRFDYLLN